MGTGTRPEGKPVPAAGLACVRSHFSGEPGNAPSRSTGHTMGAKIITYSILGGSLL